MSGGAVAALVLGGVVVVGGGVGTYLYFRSRNRAVLNQPLVSRLPAQQQQMTFDAASKMGVADMMTTVGPKAATGGGSGGGKLASTLDTLGGYQAQAEKFVNPLVGSYVGKFLGSGVGNATTQGLNVVTKYTNPIAITKATNKVLSKVPVVGKLFSW